MKIVVLISLTFILWSVYGFFASRVESPKYSVLRKMKGYEVREYGPRIFAQTSVQGSYTESMSSGFSIVARYIFGANEKKESIAMTAPVTAQNSQSEKIAMTAPVLTQNQGDVSTISFSMPDKYIG
jgi:SOUL heme-binding protein